ncbi:integral membrane protein [Rutstroemia sp. NJR-2017a BBW]|nr:integral membrane protein [Rutstroemia sp. NJR-2017a BBW]
MWVYNASPEVNAASNYPTILGVSIPILLLMVVTVLARLWVRLRTVRGIGADDWAIFAAALCSIIYNGLTITQSRWGLGLPLALRPKVNLNPYSTVNFAGRPFYMMGILGFKVSLCFSYLRILSKGQPAYRMLVKRSWRPKTPGTCLPFGPTNYGLASTTITFDVIIFFLPIPFLYSLNMNSRKKFGIIGVFALGLFTTVCSIMRMTQIPVIATGSGNSTMLVLWGNIEMNVGIILTCMPVLAPLFKVFGQKFSSYGNGSHSGPQSHNMQVFTKSGTHNNTNTGTKFPRYPENISDNESQETILNADKNRDKDVDKDDAGHASIDSVDSKNKGIMRTVQVDVEREPAKTGDYERMGNRMN